MPRQIPRKIDGVGRTDTLTVGAQKALKNFMNEYPSKDKALQVYLDKAQEKGSGTTLRQKINSTYKTGAKLK